MRCSRTLTWCVPPSGSTKANILAVPLRTYSQSVFRSLPGTIGRGFLIPPPEAGMAFRPCIRPDVFHHRKVHKRQGHPPCRLLIPGLLLMGCTSSRFCEVEVCFFKALRIASLPTGVSKITFDSSSNKRIVHREYPSGTGPQASSMSRASVRPSTLRLALSELMFLLNSVTALMPPSMYFVTVLVTVAIQTPLDFALCSWVKTFPCASSRSRII